MDREIRETSKSRGNYGAERGMQAICKNHTYELRALTDSQWSVRVLVYIVCSKHLAAEVFGLQDRRAALFGLWNLHTKDSRTLPKRELKWPIQEHVLVCHQVWGRVKLYWYDEVQGKQFQCASKICSLLWYNSTRAVGHHNLPSSIQGITSHIGHSFVYHDTVVKLYCQCFVKLRKRSFANYDALCTFVFIFYFLLFASFGVSRLYRCTFVISQLISGL